MNISIIIILSLSFLLIFSLVIYKFVFLKKTKLQSISEYSYDRYVFYVRPSISSEEEMIDYITEMWSVARLEAYMKFLKKTGKDVVSQSIFSSIDSRISLLNSVDLVF